MNYNELITRLIANAGSGRSAKDIALRDAATAIDVLTAELEDERYRHDRLQDFEVAESQELERVKAYLEYANLALMGKAIAEIKEFDGIPVDRLRELAKADKEKRLVVLPCEMRGPLREFGKPVSITDFLDREEAEAALNRKDCEDG